MDKNDSNIGISLQVVGVRSRLQSNIHKLLVSAAVEVPVTGAKKKVFTLLRLIFLMLIHLATPGLCRSDCVG